ncbi:MAG: hypothetical protein FWG78_04670 [Coriobacteriia bacterium]|nr:hypothetical protein [Coriobacteriia bacterium]
MQRAINQFARAAVPEARLHDVFTREAEDTWHKEVWVQNTGNVPFVARIQAREFMQWLQDGGTDGSNMLNEYLTTAQDSRIPIAFAPLNTANTDAMDAMAATLLESGWGTSSLIDTDTANPWFVIPAASWTNHGTTWDDPPPAPATPDPFGKYWEWGSSGAGPTRTDLSVSVMTFAQWDASRPADTWVLCEDGFFYYSSAVDPATDTALLMNTISYNNARLRSEAFYYAIDLTMEVVSKEDANAMRYGADPFEGGESPWTMQAAGPNGREVINHIWEPTAPPIGGFSITIDGISEDFGNTDQAVTIAQGGSLSFEVTVEGDSNLTYLWQTTNSPWSDAPGTNDEAEYTVNTTAPGTYEFRVLASNGGSIPAENDGNTTASSTITVTIFGPPTGGAGAYISTSSSANIGTQTTTTLAHDGPTPRLFITNPTTPHGSLMYLWQYSTTSATGPWTNATSGGQNTNTYTGLPVVPGTTYYVRCLVSNDGSTPGTTGNTWTSSNATVVRAAVGIGGDPITIGNPQRIVIDGIPFWRIASSGDYDLIVTQYVYGTNPAVDFTGSGGPTFNATGNGSYWLSNSASGSSPANVSNLQASMDTWWNALSPATHPTLNAAAIQADFGNGSGVIDGAVTSRNFGVETGLTTNNAGNIANVNFTTFPQAQSRPSNPVRAAAANTTSNASGSGIVTFALSGTEILRYFPNTATGGSGVPDGPTTDTVLRRIGRGAGANHAGTTNVRDWWSRSRGGNATTAGDVDTNGGMYGSWGRVYSDGTWDVPNGTTITNTNRGLRPALWVRR